MHIDSNQSRRAFLRRAAQLGAIGAAAPFLDTLGLIGEAAAQSSSDYKALVCVFLYGGNDNWNTMPPYDPTSYNAYRSARPNIAIPHASLGATALSPANDLRGQKFALNPALAPLMPAFRKGKLAPIFNIGTLIEPTSKSDYLKRAVRLPPKLFSHNDQQSYVQSFQVEGADAGWGGRMGDLIQSSNGTAAMTCISLQGRSLWLSGQNVTPYAVSPGSVTELIRGGTRLYSSAPAYDALRQLMTFEQEGSWISQEHAKVVNRSLQLSDSITSALARIPESSLTTFKSTNSLSEQLKMVARLIAVGPSLGLRRQVFFTSLGGWDHHSALLRNHPGLLGNVGNALSEFYAATEQLGVADQVTTFTASDFGRMLVDNGDGSDHGWGSTQFAIGGAVPGGRIFGAPPEVGINGKDDFGGRLIPTTSFDQLAATLGLWFGLPESSLPMILPNLANFDTSSWDLGFV